eukprot:Lankesteria_metandrocarpae@DN5385_c0_g1_i6.p1
MALFLHVECLAEYDNGTDNRFLTCGKWSPTGTCWLTAAADNVLRLYSLPDEEKESLNAAPTDSLFCGDRLIDFAWLPPPDRNPYECGPNGKFVEVTRGHPIHLRNAACQSDVGMKNVVASYSPLDDAYELSSVYCLEFKHDATKLYAGARRAVRVFDTARGGSQSSNLKFNKTRKNNSMKVGGIISSMSSAATSYSRDAIAFGTFSGDVGVCCDKAGGAMVWLARGGDDRRQGMAASAGTVQVKWVGEHMILSGHRQSGHILAWDIRYDGAVYAAYCRSSPSAQRLSFGVTPDTGTLWCGDVDGNIASYDTATANLLSFTAAHTTTVSAVDCHPQLPLLLSCSGTRRPPQVSTVSCGDSSEDEMASDPSVCSGSQAWGDTVVNCCRVWRTVLNTSHDTSTSLTDGSGDL